MARNKHMMAYREENTTARTTLVPSSTEPTFERVQARAYEIFLARGNRPGTAEDDWSQAERELKAEREAADQ